MLAPALILLAQAAAPMADRPLPPPPRYEVPRASSRVQVDGKLTESAWQKAPAVELLFPWEQAGAKQKTRVRLLWDDDNLYAAFECEDADITAQFSQRDDPTYRDDAVEIFINPKPEQSDYIGLEMNARAVLYDYFRAFPKHVLRRYDLANVQLATDLRGTLNARGDEDEGWTLELAIPWANFDELGSRTAPKPGTEWRAILNRWDGVEPARRLSVWSDTGTVRPNPHNPDRFGYLTFVAP
jgi:hypothetical protein